MRQSAKQRIASRIYGHGRGWVFSPSDFLADFKRFEIDDSLQELKNCGTIRQLSRGLYDYPIYSEILNKYVAPDIFKVAEALARKFSWRIQPAGETALNYLGLSTQIAACCLFLSDGPSKSYDILGQTIKFKHTALKESSITNIDAAVVIQALKATGSENITKEFLQQLQEKYSYEEWQKIKKNCHSATQWVQNYINQLAERGGSNVSTNSAG